jgi:hypothetical protein
MQPTYMPWAGYLGLIAEVDTFVYLDDAQYERGSWQQRNRVLVQGEPHWLTVPVLRPTLGVTIRDAVVDDAANWRRKHATLLANIYARHPFRDDALELAALAQQPHLQRLADLNIALIEHCCRRLNLGAKRVRASALGVPGKRTERVIALCEAVGATTYVSPPGAQEYLEADDFRSRSPIALEFHHFPATPYAQRGAAEFKSHLSILDVVANLGWASTADYVRGAQAPDRGHLP